MNSTSTPPLIEVSEDNKIATITLNRPAQYNALSIWVLDALHAALLELAEREDIHVIILAANGKAFCCGHDLKELQRNDAEFRQATFDRCSKMMRQIVAQPQPVIAKIQGIAAAAGCQLVATCDLAISAKSATFGVSGINIGLFCATPAVALSRNISRKHAMDMLLTGKFIAAEQALDYGLINQVVADDQLDTVCLELAETIRNKPPRAIRMGKQSFYRQLNTDLADAYHTATDTITSNYELPETQEGIQAFIEKRTPNWEH